MYGRVDLGVAVLAGVQVEHEGDERALQPRAPALAARRSASPEIFTPRSKSMMPERGAEVPVRLGGEVVACASALPRAARLVLAVVLADRHRRVGQVRQLQQHRRPARPRPRAQLGVRPSSCSFSAVPCALTCSRASPAAARPISFDRRFCSACRVCDSFLRSRTRAVGGGDAGQVDGCAQAVVAARTSSGFSRRRRMSITARQCTRPADPGKAQGYYCKLPRMRAG